MNGATRLQAHETGERGRVVKFVYFVLNESGHVKIGSSWSPHRRLSTLQTGSADRLTLIGAVPGDAETERAWHSRFAPLNVGGEWFAYEGELKDAITTVCSEVGAMVERIAALENERFLLSEDIKDVYDEIARQGMHKAALEALVKEKVITVDPLETSVYARGVL